MNKVFRKNTLGLKVDTPFGYKTFAGVAYMGDKEILKISLHNGIILECSIDHKIYISKTKYLYANELILNQGIFTKNGISKITSIESTGKIEPVYDLIEVEDGNKYYTNGILSSNCQFLTADSTLINPVTLLKLQGVNPIFKTNEIRWYSNIKPNMTYLVALDPSAGVGKDYAAIEVYSLPEMKQVAEWTHNQTSIPNQIKIMQNIITFIASEMKKFPEQKGDLDIYFTLENNTWGEAALQVVSEIGEDRFDAIMMHEPKVRGGPRLRKGLNTNIRTKSMACSKFKSLLESNKLLISSKALIRQLKFFVSKGESFAAKVGENDDCIMASLLCVRMMQLVTRWDEDVGNLLKDDFTDDAHEEPMPMVFGY